MLVIISEIDNQQYLADNGVIPDFYYTDFDAFSNRLMLLNHADVVAILTRTNFNGRQVIKLLKELRKQENTEEINRVWIFSSTHEVLSDYYYFTNNLKTCVHMNKSKKFKRSESPIDFYEMFRYKSENPQTIKLNGSKVFKKAKDEYNRRDTKYDGYLNMIRYN